MAIITINSGKATLAWRPIDPICEEETTEPTNCAAIDLTNGTQGDKTYSYTNCSGEFISNAFLGGFESVQLCVEELNGEPNVSYETGISMSTGGSCT